jgi:protein O-mannosyl-transferase
MESNSKGRVRGVLFRSEARRRTAFTGAALALLAALPYLNTLFNGFVYDDLWQVLGNPYIKSFGFLPKIFGTTVWSFRGAQGVSNYYRPMMTLSYLICYKLFGPLAYGFHLANVCFHAGVTVLVFAVALELFGDRALAWVAACLFALHPVHTESVDWIAAITGLEVTFFYLLTFWLFLKLPARDGGRSVRVKLALLACFGLTLLSKEQSLTFPLVAMVYEHFYREDRASTRWNQKLARYGELWLMDLGYILFRVRFLGAFAPQTQMSGSRLTLYQTFLSAVALAGQYAGKLLLPVHLCLYYVFRKSSTVWDPRVFLGFLCLLVCGILFVAAWRKSRMTSFCFVWMALTLAPVLDAHFLAGNVFAERYLYLPSAGFAWLAGWGAVTLWRRMQGRNRVWRGPLAAAGVAVMILCAVRIFTRNRIWKNDLTLYADTLRTSPDATHIRNNLGVVYWDRGETGEAEKEWLEALKISPHDPLLPIILSNLGLVYANRKDYGKAGHFFSQAILLNPNYTDAHLHLGELYLNEKDLGDAELQLQAAVALSPLLPSARNVLGRLYFMEGKLDAAEIQFRTSVKIAPSEEGYDGLADALVKKGDLRGAEFAFCGALALNDYDSHAHFGMARIARSRGRNALALHEYQRGLETDPHNQEALQAVGQLKGLSKGDHAEAP